MKSRSTITRGEADTDTTTSTTTAEGAGWTTGATGTATGAATTEEATGTEAAGAAAVTSEEGATAVGEEEEAAGETSEITITETNATEETTEEMTAGTTVGTTGETIATGTSESGVIIESNTNTARTTVKSSSSSTTSAATTTGNVVVAEAAAAARRGVAVGRTEVAAEGAERISSSSRTSPRHLLRRGPEARARSVRAIRGSRANNSSKARPSIRLSRRRPPIGAEGGVVAAEDVELAELAAEEAALAMVSHLPPSLNYLSLN